MQKLSFLLWLSFFIDICCDNCSERAMHLYITLTGLSDFRFKIERKAKCCKCLYFGINTSSIRHHGHRILCPSASYNQINDQVWQDLKNIFFSQVFCTLNHFHICVQSQICHVANSQLTCPPHSLADASFCPQSLTNKFNRSLTKEI